MKKLIRILDSAKDLKEIEKLIDRRGLLTGEGEDARTRLRSVEEILRNVQLHGDQALLDYTKAFDQVELSRSELRVGKAEFDQAYREVAPEELAALRTAKENILRFHRRQLKNSWSVYEDNGVILGQRYIPLDSVGLYVPGGTGGLTPLVSSVFMNTLPAVVAGVGRIIICTPPRADKSINPYLLVAAAEAGIDEVYKVGGAQAIAAMAFGTHTIPRVDKIVGPGNAYVTIAKRLVYGRVGLDMLAGPSEILIVADHTAEPKLLAADLLSQAEHDPMSGAILLTPSSELIEETAAELNRQVQVMPRREIAEAALRNFSALIRTADLAEAIELANDCAPEHLELIVEDPYLWLGRVKHAGAVFLGAYSPEPIGDYVAGTNHVLPTNGTARFASALSVDDFVKKMSVISYTPAGVREYGPAAVRIARLEGLEAHAMAVELRLKEET
ncbi:MAG TPA: histidinol dehydrogenase [Bacillota bacterium]